MALFFAISFSFFSNKFNIFIFVKKKSIDMDLKIQTQQGYHILFYEL